MALSLRGFFIFIENFFFVIEVFTNLSFVCHLFFANYIDVKEYIRANRLVPKRKEQSQQGQHQEPEPTIKVEPTNRIEKNVADYTDIELSNMRKVIAKRLTLSKVYHASCPFL
jgi:hypothetical protein